LSCTMVHTLLSTNEFIDEMRGQPLFGLFDFDQAYNQWKGIRGTEIQPDPFLGKIIKRTEKDVYAIMLPVSRNKEIAKQVIKNKVTFETFCHESCYEIEHVFYGSKVTKSVFREEDSVGGGKKIIFMGDKVNFAKNTLPIVETEYFKTFIPMFEFIRSKC
jgi:hypothetical protein